MCWRSAERFYRENCHSEVRTEQPPTQPTTPGYILCYDPTNPNAWMYQPDENIVDEGCGAQVPNNRGCPCNMQPFTMPSVTNSSGARMIYSNPALCP